jgi:peptidylprolyl isomerase
MAKTGDTVKVHYTCTLEDGTVFDSTSNKEPLEFVLGAGTVIPGFEAAVTGMQAGESKTVNIPSEQAYGQRDDSKFMEINRSELPPEVKPEAGQVLQMRQADGNTSMITVSQVNDDSITVDTNHPLAGKNLTFQIELVEVKQAAGSAPPEMESKPEGTEGPA